MLPKALSLLFFFIPAFLSTHAQISFSLPPNAASGRIIYEEYFIDADPGFGNGTSISVNASTDVTSINFPVDLGTISMGVHRIYFRAKSEDGSWSITNAKTIFKALPTVMIPSNPAVSDVVAMEYFIDTEPGYGRGKQINIEQAPDVTANNFRLDLTGLADGVHHVFFRVKEAGGIWSETNVTTFNILKADVMIPPNPSPGTITRFEYFFDRDPGFGKGITVAITPTTDMSTYNIVADISVLKSDSTHTLYIRTFDDWSLTSSKSFTIGTTLPLTWISFDARKVNDQVRLYWETAHEVNTDHFEVERSSDGILYSKVGTVAALNKTANDVSYFFDDVRPLNGISYYRLKQVDKDRHFSYSIVLFVKLHTQLRIAILGNPVHQNLRFRVSGSGARAVHIVLSDVSGKRYKSLELADGDHQADVSDLPAGMYFLVADGNVITIPFTKQ